MDDEKARRTASEAVFFVASGREGEVRDPAEPLWPGIYRRIETSHADVWIPVTLAEWKRLPPMDRLELVVQQMRQIAYTTDAEDYFTIDLESEALNAGLSAEEVKAGIQKALCRVYREIVARRTVATALGNLANALLIALFKVDIPIASYTDEAAISLILVYGERYCKEQNPAASPREINEN